MPIPIVEPFFIPELGLWFTDHREATGDDWATAVDILTAVTMRGWCDPIGHRAWCNEDPTTQQEIEAAYEVWLATNPGGTRDQFKASGGEAVDLVCMDESLQIIRLIARRTRRGPARGAFIMQNITVLRRSPERYRVRCLPIMGVRPAAPMSVPRTWGHIGEFVLENDLPTRGGMSIRIAEVDFPDTTTTTFAVRPGSGLRSMWDRLAPVCDQVTSNGDNPLRVRARRERGTMNAEPIVIRERT